MKKKTKSTKNLVTFPADYAISLAFAILRIDNAFIPASQPYSNSSKLKSLLFNNTTDIPYPLTKQDIAQVPNCREHFQKLAMKYLADTITNYERRQYVISGSDLISEDDISYVAAMPMQYIRDIENNKLLSKIRHSKGPIPDINIDDKIRLVCEMIQVKHVAHHGFYAHLAITESGHAICFNTSRPIFLNTLSYEIAATVKDTDHIEFNTQEPVTALTRVKILS